MYYADDGCFTTGSLADLQAIFDLNWFLAKQCGLTVKVKGAEKTAYTVVRYSEGKAYNLETAPIRLPDGTRIPQILVPAATVAKAGHTVRAASKQRAATNKTANGRDTIDSTSAAAEVATYTYLGTAYTASWQCGMEPARERTRWTVINMVQMVRQLTQLDLGELQQSIDTIVEGVVGFAGRGTVITWEDCEAMEGARRKALAQHGSTVTWPRAHVYTETSAGG